MSKTNDFIKGALIAAVSAGAALLFAPKSGKELREDVKDQAEKLRDEGEKYTQNLATDIKESMREVERKNTREKESVLQEAERYNSELEHELGDLAEHQVTVETESGEVTELTRPSGDVSGTVADPNDNTSVPSFSPSDVDDVKTESGEFSQRPRPRGDVAGTSNEPTTDEVVPADKLDEALKDNEVKDIDDLS